MQKEKIQEFTRRVSQDNRTSLIVTMYDIMLTYLDEAKAALEAEDREGFKAGLRHADRVLVQLQDSLNFKYSPADTLYALYVYCREELALAMAKQDLTGSDMHRRFFADFAEASPKLRQRTHQNRLCTTPSRYTRALLMEKII